MGKKKETKMGKMAPACVRVWSFFLGTMPPWRGASRSSQQYRPNGSLLGPSLQDSVGL